MRAVAALLIALAATAAAGAEVATGADADPAAAMLELSRAIVAQRGDEAVTRSIDLLQPIAARAVLSPAAVPDGARIGLAEHVVGKGENPTVIARRYRIGIGLLTRLNQGLSAGNLKPGQRLKVLDLASTPVRLEVIASRYRLLAWRGDVVIAAMPCGLGRDASPTPRGDTRIKLRVRDPEWRDPDSHEVIPPNDPRNILGGFWLGFEPGDDGRFEGIGAHGYTGEASERWIEKPGSHGCVRLLQPDIGALYDLALVGTAVSVRD